MTSIIMRSALVYHGHNPAPDVACVVHDLTGRHVVTWADVLDRRRERQRTILENKRHVTRWHAWKVWVAYYDMDLFGGWQAFIERTGSRSWIDRDRDWLIRPLMELFPLVLIPGEQYPYNMSRTPEWDLWKQEFARCYRRRQHHRRPLGGANVWWDGQERPQLRPPGGLVA